MKRNGDSQMRAAQREREKQREHNREMAALEDGHHDPREEHIRQDLLEQLTKTDLNKPSKKLLENLITPDWVLANLSEDYLWELKWRLEVTKEKYKALHPGKECVVTGEFRQYVYDDKRPEMKLKPLSQQQELAVDNFFDAVWLRLTRAKDFKQQEIMRTEIRSVQTQNDRGESGGGLLDRFK